MRAVMLRLMLAALFASCGCGLSIDPETLDSLSHDRDDIYVGGYGSYSAFDYFLDEGDEYEYVEEDYYDDGYYGDYYDDYTDDDYEYGDDDDAYDDEYGYDDEYSDDYEYADDAYWYDDEYWYSDWY